MAGTCPNRAACDFFNSIEGSVLLRIKYAPMYPYCNSQGHERCARWARIQQGLPVSPELLPDGRVEGLGAHRTDDDRTKRGARVLVVDGMPPFRKVSAVLVQNACRREAEIVEAESAEAAIELLSADTSGWTAVVTEYNMSGMTGLDLIRIMRTHPALVRLPAIVFTSDRDDENRRSCEELPAVRWLAKRPDREPFVEAWRELVLDAAV